MNGLNDDINDFVPSLLNPRTVNKENFSLTQNSVVSRCSLSLNRKGGLAKRNTNQNVPAKRSLFNVKENKKIGDASNSKHCAKSISTQNDLDVSGFEELYKENNFNQNAPVKSPIKQLAVKHLNYLDIHDLANASTVNLSADDINTYDSPVRKSKENTTNGYPGQQAITSTVAKTKVTQDQGSFDFSVFEDSESISYPVPVSNIQIGNVVCSLKSGSSATQLNCEDTILYSLNEEPHVSISFGIQDCDYVDLTAKNSNIKKVLITHKDKNINLDCEIEECTPLSTESEYDENMNNTSPNSRKRSGVVVDLEIKKKKLPTDDSTENPKVLILKTDAIEKLSHVIVQPQNCKLVKRQVFKNTFCNNRKTVVRQAGRGYNGKSDGSLKQISITSYFARDTRKFEQDSDVTEDVLVEDDAADMSKNAGVSDLKCIRAYRSDWKGNQPTRCRVVSAPKRAEALGTEKFKVKNASARSSSPRKAAEQSCNLSVKTRSNRQLSAGAVPHYKIVAGTHFAVDAFSYGDIPNVKHYFLTHFHSDHYSGLKKNFNKLLYCSKITGDLCVSRLGVNPKFVHTMNLDETMRIDGVQVTAVDANHCPGAVMLIFGLPSGKTILHTGDFRASPEMESYPLFWNSDIHTIYLDTTYCNPRYDFPTQEQSLEMALSLLRQKKSALEKVGKKFSSVLIVCGTYTIGKEKFFLGMARRVGCSIWACPEKDKVLQLVEGRSFCYAPAQSCQLHVVPMRDLSHDKLKSYLESLQGAFTEVVAFKPSGWENGKNSTVEKDMVTIHGIPYSEHSSFSELIRFVKFLKPKQVVPTVDISGGVKSVQKYFPCPLMYKEDGQNQSKVTDYFSIENRQQVPAVT